VEARHNAKSTARSPRVDTAGSSQPAELGTSAGRRAKSASRADSKGERTRNRIVVAARAVFERDGYLEARVSDIVAEIGLGHGSFYTYFPSKREVFQEIVSEVGDQLRAVVARQPEDDPGDALVSLDRANRRYLRFYRENARILTAVEEAATVDTAVYEFRLQRREFHIQRVTSTIERLQERGLADPAIDAHYTAGALVAMLSSLAFWCATIPDAYDEERTAQTITTIWAQALGLRQPRPPVRYPQI
jgi:AcrR family transcriptional regulator